MKEFIARSKLMGSAFELCVVNADQREADELLRLGIEEIKRIEVLLSEFTAHSVTTRINQTAAARPVAIDEECFNLVKRSLDISRLTGHCFDITVSPLKKIFSFKNTHFEMPSAALIKQTLQYIGYDKIDLNENDKTIHFTNDNVKISFSAIGKGYAADRVKQLWLSKGVTSGYINASGDLTAFGSKQDGQKWKIAIADPDNTSQVLMYVPMHNASVATSGDYEQFFIHNNTRYSHNIDPRTGMPVKGIKSVSVFSPSAELSDAMATAIYVMGVKKGIGFANQLPQTHCIIIDDQNNIHFSNQLAYEASLT